MKRDFFIIMGLGLLMSATVVSCEDKDIDKDDASGTGKEGSEGIYINVQDSALTYYDGKLSSKNCSYYDSDGKVIRELSIRYGSNGNLLLNQEGTYSYNKYSYNTENDYTVLYDNHGLMYDTKAEVCYKGSDNNSTSTRQNYVLVNDEWLLSSEFYGERNDIMSREKNILYGYIDGQRIIISSSIYETSKYSQGSTSMSTSNSYRKTYTIDDNAPAYTTSSSYYPIKSVNGEKWQRTTSSFDAGGHLLESLTQESDDSIEWKETRRVENKYNSNGKKLEEIQTEVGNNHKYSFTYDSKDNLIKEECFRKYENDVDFVLYRNVQYSYSIEGKLMAIVVSSISNDIVLPQLVGEDAESGVTFVSGNSVTPFAGGMSGNNPDSTICFITCDTNGFPLSETLYRQDSDSNWDLYGRCTVEYDSDGNCLNYVVEMLEDGTWIETASMQSTYDSKGNVLSQYVRSMSTRYFTWDNPQSILTETESTIRNEYNSLGYISYSLSSSINNQHYVYSYGTNEVKSESKQERFYSTIKVK